MSKVCVKTKNSNNRIVMQSHLDEGFVEYMLLGTAPLQRNTEEHKLEG
jgi:hypothetical protein